MSLKKLKIISVISIFLLCFLTHYMYEWFKNDLFQIIFPVNESVWEHMKMIFSAVIINGLIEFLIIKIKKIKVNNYYLSVALGGVFNVLIYLVIYIPFLKNKPSFLVILILLFISIILSQMISYYILKYKSLKKQKIIGLLLIIISYLVFGYFTYKPLKNDLFLDAKNNKYGINIFIL